MEQHNREDWLRFCAGDQKALERIFNRNNRRIYTYSLCLSGDRQLSEDVVQESFVRLMGHKHNDPAIQSVKNWLFICARNLLFNHFRSNQTSAASYAYETTPATPPAMDMETREFVRWVLGRLDPEERDLILLREQQQFSIAELAQMLGKSPEALRIVLYRIRKKMQKLAGTSR